MAEPVTHIKHTKPTAAELKNMAELWHIKKSAQDAFNEAGKALADKYEMDTTEIKAYVSSIEQGKLNVYEKKLESRQMLLNI